MAIMFYKIFKLFIVLFLALLFMFGMIGADSTFSISPLLGLCLIFAPLYLLYKLSASGWLDDVADLVKSLDDEIFG